MASPEAPEVQAAGGRQPDGNGVEQPVIQSFSGTRQRFALIPGGIQYTLDAVFAQPAREEKPAATSEQPANHTGAIQGTEKKEPARRPPDAWPKPTNAQLTFDVMADEPVSTEAEGTDGQHRNGVHQPAVNPFRGARYALISGGIQLTLDALYNQAAQEAETKPASQPAEMEEVQTDAERCPNEQTQSDHSQPIDATHVRAPAEDVYT